MYSDLPLWASIGFVLAGLVLLAWSSDRFVAGAAALARNLGVSPFIVGMVVVGFGTSAPELLVSMFSGLSGYTNLSLGNAYGSCVFNIAAILGVAALVRPLVVKRQVVLAALPILSLITIISWVLLRDATLSRVNALILLALFFVVMPLYCKFDKAPPQDDTGDVPDMSTTLAVVWSVVGLGVMVTASHMLVWGAVDIARALKVSELLIGLTIVAIGTSIPELASAIAASRRNESELVLGNIVGSNIFNMLAVVGIAGVISPSDGFSKYILSRDLPALFLVTLLIGAFGFNFKKPREKGVINRFEGAIWVLMFCVYMALTLYQETCN